MLMDGETSRRRETTAGDVMTNNCLFYAIFKLNVLISKK